MKNEVGNRIYFTSIPLILIVMMSMCNNDCTRRLEGWKDLYLFNCSGDAVTIETSVARIENGMVRFYKTGTYESAPVDTITLNQRIYYYQWLFGARGYTEKGDSLLILLEPEEGMRIIHLEWLISPTRFKERDLNVDNLRIITKSDSFIARNRKEILNLRFNRRCNDGIYFKTIKYGREGTPVMRERVWRGR